MMKSRAFMRKPPLKFRLLYYWGKLMGINPLTLSSSNDLSVSYFSYLYACFLISAYSYIFHCTLTERFKVTVPGDTPMSVIASCIYLGIGFLETIVTWFTYGFYQNRLKSVVKSFAKADEISQKLGISENYEKRFRTLAGYATVVNIFFFAALRLNNDSAKRVPNYKPLIWMSFSTPRVTTISSAILFVWCLFTAKCKFHYLNDKLRFVMRNDCARIGQPHNEMGPGLKGISRSNEILLPDKINIISELHRELRDLVRRIVEHFALPVLFHVIVLISNVSLNGYITACLLNRNRPASGDDYIYLTTSSFWTLTPLLQLTIMSEVCESILKEANEARNILHAILNNCNCHNDTREAAKLKAFSLELLRNQVSISIYGLLDLDNLLIYRILKTATMYFVIILQFYS